MVDVNSDPLVSVVIPVRNESRFIGQCLLSIFSADPVPGGLEVLVVDGMSDDGTRETLAALCLGQPHLRVLENPRLIPPAGMNIGITASRGKWIIPLSAHSEYPRNYFNLCLKTSERTGADNVGGQVITVSPQETIQGKLVQAVTTHQFGVGNSSFRVGACEGKIDTAAFGCYRREVFERIGLHDEHLRSNHDYEFNRRLRSAGGFTWYSPAIQVRYYCRNTLTELFARAFITGRDNPWMWYIAPYSFAWRHAVPLAFIGTLFSGILLYFVMPWLGNVVLKTVLVPYILLAIMGSLHQSIRHDTWMFPCLPFVFSGYHLAYGLGGLWGICLLLLNRTPVQLLIEPWPGARCYRAWPTER